MARAPDWDSRIGRRVTLRDLHILFAVVQHGSMAKAGAQLGKSQSAVSQAIAAIEQAVGVRLLDRSARGVEPTIYGRALLRRGRAAFDELRLGVHEIESLSDPGVGEVRIGSSELVSATFLAPIIDHLSARYPRLQLHVVETSSAIMQFPELYERRVDLRIVIMSRPMEAELRKEFDVEALYYDEICLAVGSSSRWARRRKIDIAELHDEPMVVPSSEAAGGAAVMEAFRARGLPPPSVSVTTFSVALRNSLGMTGRFVVALPASALRPQLSPFALQRLPIDLPMAQLAIATVTLKNRTLSPAAQLLIECAREVARSISPERTADRSRPTSRAAVSAR